MIYYKYGLNFISWFEDDKLYINHIDNRETNIWDLKTYTIGSTQINSIFKYKEWVMPKNSDIIMNIDSIQMNKIIEAKQRDLKLNNLLYDI